MTGFAAVDQQLHDEPWHVLRVLGAIALPGLLSCTGGTVAGVGLGLPLALRYLQAQSVTPFNEGQHDIVYLHAPAMSTEVARFHVARHEPASRTKTIPTLCMETLK